MAEPDRPDRSALQALALLVGAAGIAGALVVWLLWTAVFWRAYLVAYLFYLGIAGGSLVLLMIHHLTGGRWGEALRGTTEAAARTMPLMALLTLPLWFGLEWLYPWASASQSAAHHALQHKAAYLSPPLVAVRIAIYFAAWIILARLVTRSPGRAAVASGPGLVLYSLTILFASTDLVMSLQPEWFSTMYSVIFGVGQMLSAVAFGIAASVLVAWNRRPPDEAAPKLLLDLGNLLMAMVVVWAYVAFSQFMLIWSANLPEETPWYLTRLAGGWAAVAWGLAGLYFALPFALLLSRRLKLQAGFLAAVAVFVLVMRAVELFWEVVPAFPPPTLLGHWPEMPAAVGAVLGMGGVWMTEFLRQLGRAAEQ